MKTFTEFWDSMSPEERLKLAKDCGSSNEGLRQFARGHRTFRRPEEILGYRLMKASKDITPQMVGLGDFEKLIKKRGV